MRPSDGVQQRALILHLKFRARPFPPPPGALMESEMIEFLRSGAIVAMGTVVIAAGIFVVFFA